MILRDTDIEIKDLIDLEYLKTEMHGAGMVPEDYGDEILKNRISMFSEKIVQVCGQFFDQRSLSILHSGSDRIALPLKFPLDPNSTVLVEEFYQSDGSWNEVESINYKVCWNRLVRVDMETRVVSMRPYQTEDVFCVWKAGFQNYRVTAKFGLRAVPAAVKQALILLILSELDPEYSVQTSNLKSERTDKYQYERFPSKSSVPELTGNYEADSLLYPFVYRPPEDRMGYLALGKRRPSSAAL